MIVRAILSSRVVEFARSVFSSSLMTRNEPDCQMHQEHVARGKIGQQVFGATAETRHDLTSSRATKSFWNGNRGLSLGSALQSSILHDRLQPRRTVSTSGNSASAGVHLRC